MHIYSKVIKFISGTKPRYSYGNAEENLPKRHFLSVTGFTLLELLIVVIIVGILASLAIPRYMKVTENAKGSEAAINLNALRGAELAYFGKFGELTTDFDKLAVENPAENINAFFTYELYDYNSSYNPFYFYISAQRKPGSPYSGNYIVITEQGGIHGNYPPGLATRPTGICSACHPPM